MCERLRAVCARILKVDDLPREADLRKVARDLQTSLTELEKAQVENDV